MDINQSENYVINIKAHYAENGFEVNPYTQEEIENVISAFGSIPVLLKQYLTHIGRLEEETQFEKSILNLESWEFVGDKLVFADYGPSCEFIQYAINKSDLSESNPLIYVRYDLSDKWEKWDFTPEEDCHFENLVDFFLCAATENTQISIEEYRANRRFWEKVIG